MTFTSILVTSSSIVEKQLSEELAVFRSMGANALKRRNGATMF